MIDNKTYKLLKKFYRKKELTLEEVSKATGTNEEKSPSKSISALSKNHFISTWQTNEIINDSGDRKWIGFRITLEGNAYVEQRRRDLRNFWVPYLITTFIAVLSLAASLAEHWDTILSWFSFCNFCS